MNAHVANLVNATAMILLGLWGYTTSDNPSPTALIPVFMGVILLVMSQGVKNEQKAQAHVAVIVTLLALISLAVKPLPGALQRGEALPIARISIMVLTNLIALVYFIRSFIAARKNRAA